MAGGSVPLDDLLPSFDETGRHAADVPAWTERPETGAVRAETQALVRSSINRLPAPYWEVLILRDLEDRDTDKTAALLGISRALVKTRLHRARQALRTLLELAFRAEEDADVALMPEPPLRRFRQ